MRDTFLEALATDQPVPGGGSAAAYGATVALCLLKKIARVEEARLPESSLERDFWSGLTGSVDGLLEVLERLREEDGQAYLRWARARKSSDVGELDLAFQEAVSCPLRIVRAVQKAAQRVLEAVPRCRRHLVVDLRVSLELLRGAGRGAFHIAHANARMGSDEKSEIMRRELNRLWEDCSRCLLQGQREARSRIDGRNEE